MCSRNDGRRLQRTTDGPRVREAQDNVDVDVVRRRDAVWMLAGRVEAEAEAVAVASRSAQVHHRSKMLLSLCTPNESQALGWDVDLQAMAIRISRSRVIQPVDIPLIWANVAPTSNDQVLEYTRSTYHLRAPGTLLRRLSRPQPTVLALLCAGMMS
jgi:hypothetical protein